jgi:hypothetical protein
LFHGKTVLVKATVDSENITLKLITKGISFDFLTHSLLEEDSASVVIIDLDGFGGAVSWVGDAELCK